MWWMGKPRAALLIATLVGALPAGCGLGLLQTARTTPPGTVQVTAGAGYLTNEMGDVQQVDLSSFPPSLGARVGLSPQTDLGLRQLLLAGGLIDLKHNVLDTGQPLALSLQGGIGAAYDLSSGWLLALPLTLLASYDFAWLTPYVGLGYLSFWIFGRQPAADIALEQNVGRAGHGDGVLQLTVGLALPLTSSGQTALLAEYTLLQPVLDDPGDSYVFVTNHLMSFGVRL
jgi:hypothetical protein